MGVTGMNVRFMSLYVFDFYYAKEREGVLISHQRDTFDFLWMRLNYMNLLRRKGNINNILIAYDVRYLKFLISAGRIKLLTVFLLV